MFTGIVRERGTRRAVEGGDDGVRLVIDGAGDRPATALGDSVSVNGV